MILNYIVSVNIEARRTRALQLPISGNVLVETKVHTGRTLNHSCFRKNWQRK